MSGPAKWHHSRGSTRLDGSGLFVLGLGALVLLSGLNAPAPRQHDLVIAQFTSSQQQSSQPHWMGGMALIGAALVAVGARGAPRTKVMHVAIRV